MPVRREALVALHAGEHDDVPLEPAAAGELEALGTAPARPASTTAATAAIHAFFIVSPIIRYGARRPPVTSTFPFSRTPPAA